MFWILGFRSLGVTENGTLGYLDLGSRVCLCRVGFRHFRDQGSGLKAWEMTIMELVGALGRFRV